VVAEGPWVCCSGDWFDGIGGRPQHIVVYHATFEARNPVLLWASTFGPHRSIPKLECGGLHGAFVATLSLEYATIFSSLSIILPASLLPL
jgi:hypothetical protein